MSDNRASTLKSPQATQSTLKSRRVWFITLEGGEGAGKSTAMRYLQQQLLLAGVDVLTTREPGGTVVAEQIRQILLQKQTETLTTATELLLMFAARSQHITEVIRPALARGQWVICDRFTDASYAYQGGGRGVDPTIIQTLEQFVQQDLRPDLTILLDASPRLGMQRIKKRAALDRIETEQLTFFERVRQTYLARAAQEPYRFVVIDTAKPLAAVKRQLLKQVKRLINLNDSF